MNFCGPALKAPLRLHLPPSRQSSGNVNLQGCTSHAGVFSPARTKAKHNIISHFIKLKFAFQEGASSLEFALEGSFTNQLCRPVRLRSVLKQLEEKDVDFEEIKKNLDFTTSLLEAVCLDGTR